MQDFVIEDGVLVTYTGSDTHVVIPDSVTSIGNKAFMGCESLTKIEIPDSVTGIDYSAFEDCKSLTEIEIPDSVTTIEACLFKNCECLAYVKMPASLKYIAREAFYGCASLTDIHIPAKVRYIEENAFGAHLESAYMSRYTELARNDERLVTALRSYYLMDIHYYEEENRLEQFDMLYCKLEQLEKEVQSLRTACDRMTKLLQIRKFSTFHRLNEADRKQLKETLCEEIQQITDNKDMS